MTNAEMDRFNEIWFVDFEFTAPDGESPDVICMVAREMKTCRTIRLWRDELLSLKSAPYDVGPTSLFVAYYASAEMGCHLSLGWEMPENVLDLFTEFRNATNGKEVPAGSDILGALIYHGLPAISKETKKAMRNMALEFHQRQYTDEERQALIDYCETDVLALSRLLPAMMDSIPLDRALLRGRFMKTAAQIERNGIPLDTDTLADLKQHWEPIQERIVRQVDSQYGIFDGHHLNRDRFIDYLVRENIPWPRLPGQEKLALDDDTFKFMSRRYPQIVPLRDVLSMLSTMRLSELPVGRDGRNRCLLSAFQSRTGRNQPSNSKFIFGPSRWVRNLIMPQEGSALSYIDWSQQEVGIAAALSGDPRLKLAYETGDPYWEFAKQAGAVPLDAMRDKENPNPVFEEIRDQYKECMLAVQYGMGEASLAERIGQTVAKARSLLQKHHYLYPVFWRWSDAAVAHAMQFGSLSTVFGWTVHVEWKNGKKSLFQRKYGKDGPNERSLRNFPMQANGAEMMRLACILGLERGLKICAPVHDAILIEAPLRDLEDAKQEMIEVMKDASRLVLDGLELGAKPTDITDRFTQKLKPGQRDMWAEVLAIVDELKKGGRQ
ncbi:MAG: polymerase thermostable [Pseudomonadota bacterium]|jgi:hypothetical protein